ncbi:hypothetical protein, unlikely [Trypanosoma congolense IL3000]|uniref:Uncharacterized protein n=1 Tax=Trypanosoma congolense (strain IL3000) TaxID=1068625 RepID=F9W8S0_TRYCI|nr:hypothetical protein, unlikely [Trypanosoma congolense IL3000]
MCVWGRSSQHRVRTLMCYARAAERQRAALFSLYLHFVHHFSFLLSLFISIRGEDGCLLDPLHFVHTHLSSTSMFSFLLATVANDNVCDDNMLPRHQSQLAFRWLLSVFLMRLTSHLFPLLYHTFSLSQCVVCV